MRFIIFGAGAIGGTIGGRLALGGYDVLFVDLPGPTQTIREQGLRLVTTQGEHTLRLPAVTSAEQIDFQPDDVVFLCVKSQHTQAVLEDLSAATEEVPLFCIQNGVRNEEMATRHFDQVYGVMIRGAGVCLKDGEVVSVLDPPGVCIVGRFPEGVDERVRSVAEALREVGYGVRLVPNVMQYKWGKLIRNLQNAPRAITNEADEGTQRIIEAARAEARRILKQADVDWIPQERLEKEWDALEIRSRVDIQSLGSTWQSLTRGGGTAEAEYLSGEIVRVAEHMGIDAPINRELTRIVMDMAAHREAPGRYTSAELAVLLNLKDDGAEESETAE